MIVILTFLWRVNVSDQSDLRLVVPFSASLWLVDGGKPDEQGAESEVGTTRLQLIAITRR